MNKFITRMHRASFTLGAFLFVLVVAMAISNTDSFGLEVPNKPASGFVLDNAVILSDTEEANLNNRILEIKKSTSNEIGILTLKDGEGVDPAIFGVEVGRLWDIGSLDNKNGVLLLITLDNPKRIQISVSTGLEGALTDALSGRIASNEIAPHFKDGNYYAGILAGVEAIDLAIKGEYDGSGSVVTEKAVVGGLNALYFVIIAGAMALSFMAETKSWWAGGIFGGGGGVALGVLASSLLIGVITTLLFGTLGLLLDRFLSNGYAKNKALKSKDKNHHTPWYFGGGGFGGGSSGGGGFSGGGGSFGGGGGGSSW